MTTAAERLRVARAQAGFAQAIDAVRHFNWSLAAYKQHESGGRLFPEDRAEEYAAAYGVTVNWLLHGVGSARPVPAGEITARVVELLETLDEENQRRVLAFVETLASPKTDAPDDVVPAEPTRKRYKTRADKGVPRPKKARAA